MNLPENYPTPEDDPMGLRLDMDAAPGMVIIKFSKPVVELRLNPQQTRAMAIAMLTNSEAALNLGLKDAFPPDLETPPSRLP